MTQAQACPDCGAALPSNAPEGLCPQCLLQQGAGSGVTPSALQDAHTGPYPGPIPAPQPQELARHFPHLEILELLGQGGMGAVYKARQVKLDRLVALKVLPPEVGREPAFAERFLREARALARLSHSHIVGIHDFGEVEGLYYFVMEFVDGGNLRQLMSGRPVEPARAGHIVAQVCEALDYAHGEGVVHRDIKPENILVDRKGGVKIADFGLARLVIRTPADFSLTGSRQIMGTPYYMAPEQIDRPQEVDHRADIYSLGVVLYELLTNKLPLGSFKPPSQQTRVDARFDAIVLRALAREPEQRYQTVGELKSDLEAMTGQPVQPDAPGASSFPQVVAVAIPLGRERKPPGPAATVVFTTTVYGGIGKVQGVLRLEGDFLHVEHVTHWCDLVRGRVKEQRVPLRSLAAVGLEKGVFSTSLVLAGTSLKALEKFPSGQVGRVRLGVARRDRAQAEDFVEAVQQRLAAAAHWGSPRDSVQARDPNQKDEAGEGPVADKIRSFFRSVCGYFVTGMTSSVTRSAVPGASVDRPASPARQPLANEPGCLARVSRGVLRGLLMLVFVASMALFFSVRVEEKARQENVDLLFVQVKGPTNGRSSVQIGYPSPWLKHTEENGAQTTVITPASWSWPILGAGVVALCVSRGLRAPRPRDRLRGD
jgi:tRNA A-37 threonylcarbamoyl transferase component Bud32